MKTYVIENLLRVRENLLGRVISHDNVRATVSVIILFYTLLPPEIQSRSWSIQ